MVRTGILLVVAGVVLLSVCAAGETMQFRGADGTGVFPEQVLRTNWENGEGVAWKVANPAAGWAQPVIHGGHLYVAGAVGELRCRSTHDLPDWLRALDAAEARIEALELERQAIVVDTQ